MWRQVGGGVVVAAGVWWVCLWRLVGGGCAPPICVVRATAFVAAAVLGVTGFGTLRSLGYLVCATEHQLVHAVISIGLHPFMTDPGQHWGPSPSFTTAL